jgi:hypothetical protein
MGRNKSNGVPNPQKAIVSHTVVSGALCLEHCVWSTVFGALCLGQPLPGQSGLGGLKLCFGTMTTPRGERLVWKWQHLCAGGSEGY